VDAFLINYIGVISVWREEAGLVKRRSNGGFTAVIDLLASNRFAIYLLIAIAAASLMGVVIPQRYISIPEPVYQEKYTTGLLGVLGALGIFNIFYTIWYRALIALFLVSLALCSYRGLVRLFRLRREVQGAGFERLRELGRASQKLSVSADEKQILAAFRDFGRMRRRADDRGEFLFFEGGTWSRFGPYVIHAAVLLVALGGLVGNLFGVDGSVNLAEGGDSSDKIWLTRGGTEYDLGFAIRCLDFEIEYYEGTKQPKDYKSHLQIVDDGRAVREKVIEVNDPLKYGGFTIYQSSYGLLGYRAKIRAEDSQTGRTYEFTASLGDRFKLGDTGYSFTFVNAQENYQNAGPALNLEVEAPDGTKQSVWIFKESPEFDRLRGGRFVFSYVGEDEVYYTGLSVARNPGLPLVWAGCLVLFVGLIVSFAAAHRWAAVRVEGNRAIVVYNASKYRDAWQKRFDEAVEAISKGKSG